MPSVEESWVFEVTGLIRVGFSRRRSLTEMVYMLVLSTALLRIFQQCLIMGLRCTPTATLTELAWPG